jgi:hypothetical protein
MTAVIEDRVDQGGDRGGARFFDEDSRDRGWAAKVSKRVVALTGVTILEVTATEPTLTEYLAALDRGRLTVQHTDASGERYTFAWASGYEDGNEIRIQGVVEPDLGATLDGEL